MDTTKLMFFTILVNVLLFWGNCAVSQVIQGSNQTPHQTSTPSWSSYAIKPSPLAELSDRFESIRLKGNQDTGTVNGTEFITTAATPTAKLQTLAEDTDVLSSIKAWPTYSTRKTVWNNSASVVIAPHESFNQGFPMTSTTLSESFLGMTFTKFTVVQPSRKTTTSALALWNSLQTISTLDVRVSATLEKINSTFSSVSANASLSRNTSSSHNGTENLYLRPIDDYSLVFYSIAFVIGISGNVFVLVDAFKTQKKLKTNEMLLIHLCVVNVFILSTLTPMVFLMKIGMTNSCHVIFSMTILYQYGIVYTLTAISIQHHRAIACPFSPKPSGKRITFTVVAIWVVSILQLLPLVLTDDLLPRGCLLFKNKPLKFLKRKIYYSLLTFSQYLLPFFLIVMYYIKLSVFLKKARLEIERRSDSTQEVQSPRKKRDQRVVMVIVAMVATFAVCMLPQHLQFLLTEFVFEKSFPFGTAVFTYYPVVIKACIDPVIYGAVGRKLKSSICCRRPTSSTQNEHVN